MTPSFSPRRVAMVGTIAAVIFAATAWYVSNNPPPRWELELFEWVNQWPDWLYLFIWPFMQYGVFITIPVTAAAAWWWRRRRFAAMLAFGGLAIYFGAKIVKRIADRGRPGAFLSDVQEREVFAEGSLGFTSGHAAVAATIATLTWLHLGSPWRRISLVLVAAVVVGRTYVGAHLLLDIVGGLAMGVAAGCFVALLGRERSPRQEAES